MNRTKTIYFLSAIVLIIGCYALNLSYSLFVQTEEKDIVNSVVPSLAYNLEQNTFDIPANSSMLIDLKVVNSGSADIKYGISVSDTKGTYIQLVEKEGNDIVGTLETSTVEGENSSKEVWVYITNPTDSEITDLTFDITAKYSTLNFNDEFKSNSNIDCVYTVKSLSNAILANAKSGLEGRSVFTEPEDLPTTPAEEPNGETEMILSYTEDDYTATTGNPSYYFRGNVSDNYVTFANMCWRIVRIKGDGSVKLILEDQDNTCEEMAAMTSTVGSYNEDKGDFEIANKPYGFDSKGLADYLGYEGGMADEFQAYQTTLAKKIDSTIGDAPTSDAVKSTLASKLEVGDWCNTEGTKYDSDYETILTEEQVNDKIANSGLFYYDSYIRLYGRNSKEPTLKCNGTIMNDFKDDIESPTPMYVGTLTADEIAFAGAYNVPFTTLKYNYLINDYYEYVVYKLGIDIYWWTLSPGYFDGAGSLAFNEVMDLIYVHELYSESNKTALRPSVTLKASTIIVSGGVGTIDNPYVIE